MATAGSTSSGLDGRLADTKIAHRGARRRAKQMIVQGSLAAAFARIQDLEQQLQGALDRRSDRCRCCSRAINVELELRVDAVRPFLSAQIEAKHMGSDTVDASFVDKLRRDAAEHAYSVEAIISGSVDGLRQSRKKERLPSKLRRTEEAMEEKASDKTPAMKAEVAYAGDEAPAMNAKSSNSHRTAIDSHRTVIGKSEEAETDVAPKEFDVVRGADDGADEAKVANTAEEAPATKLEVAMARIKAKAAENSHQAVIEQPLDSHRTVIGKEAIEDNANTPPNEGDSMEYYSRSIATWIVTRFVRLNGDGTWKLECKNRAEVAHCRRPPEFLAPSD